MENTKLENQEFDEFFHTCNIHDILLSWIISHEIGNSNIESYIDNRGIWYLDISGKNHEVVTQIHGLKELNYKPSVSSDAISKLLFCL